MTHSRSTIARGAASSPQAADSACHGSGSTSSARPHDDSKVHVERDPEIAPSTTDPALEFAIEPCAASCSGSESNDVEEEVEVDTGCGRGGISGRWRRGKARRLVVGEGAEQPDGHVQVHPDELLDPLFIELLDQPDDKVPAECKAAVDATRTRLAPRRQVRPYSNTVPYKSALTHQRDRNAARGRQPLHQRVLCLSNILMMPAMALVLILELIGVLPPRPPCRKCGKTLDDNNIRIRQHYVTLNSSNALSFECASGAVDFQLPREQAHWCCTCGWEQSVGVGAETWQGSYSLRQNAALHTEWCKGMEPSSDMLAEDTFLDHGKLVSGWLRKVRGVVSEVQELRNSTWQLGGAGVDVEIDEVCFRARWKHLEGDG